MSSAMTSYEVRGVLLPLQSAQLLLPNASVSEVVGYMIPDPIDGEVPEWLLGRFSWRQQSVPLVSFEGLVGLPQQEIGHRARVAICNSLNGNAECPYIGIVLTSIPHLVRISADNISAQDESEDLGEMVAQQVILAGEKAWIPDLDALERAMPAF